MVCAFFAHTTQHAENEFEKYRLKQDKIYTSDFNRFLLLEENVKNE